MLCNYAIHPQPANLRVTPYLHMYSISFDKIFTIEKFQHVLYYTYYTSFNYTEYRFLHC